MAAVSVDRKELGSGNEEYQSTTASTTSADAIVSDVAESRHSESVRHEEAGTKVSMPVIDDQSRTPTSEYPSTVPTPATPATSWASQELPPRAQNFQPGEPGNTQHSVPNESGYFAARATANSYAVAFPAQPSATTLSSESRNSSTNDNLNSASAPQSPGGPWRECFSPVKSDESQTPRPMSVPTKQIEKLSGTRPNYPNQSFAALQAQHIPPHYPRPRPLRTRSSHPSQHQSYSADDSRRSREFPNIPVIAKTAGNTPAQSPGLFSPTFSPNRSAEEHEDGEYNTPLLHPSHMQAPKE